MRFHKIEINNYRQYQNIKMQFDQKLETDLHVVIASNGVGKTNMLNAINWCLYGDEPHLSDEEESLSICNINALQEAADRGEKICIVSVKIYMTVEERYIEIYREVPVNTKTRFVMNDKLKVTIIDNVINKTDTLEGIAANEIVNQYLPKKIREYFFFDGERLHNYFGAKSQSTHIKDSIHEIAQVNLMTNVKSHLDTIKTEYQKQLSKFNPAIDELLKERTVINGKLDNIQREIADLNNAIEVSREVIKNANVIIAGSETVVEDNKKYIANTNEIEELKYKKEDIYVKIKELIKKYTILLYLYNVNSSTYIFIQEKLEKGILPPDLDVKLIIQSLREHRCAVCGQDILNDAEEHLKEMEKKFEVSSGVSHKLMEIKNDVYTAMEVAKKYKEDKVNLLKELKEIETRITENESVNVKLLKKISQCSDIENIEAYIDERAYNSDLIIINTRKLGSNEVQEKIIMQEKLNWEDKFNKAMDDSKMGDELKKYIMTAQEAMAIVSEIEQEMIDEVREKMETVTMDYFNELLWKTQTYSHIKLDTNYKLKLFHKETNESCLGSCSAAERELLALAFTIALHTVSGHNNLLFIDTPVGRVSDINRENFAKVLVEVSKRKQIILAFTPSEFSKEISGSFNSLVVSTISKLITDEIVTTKEG